MPMWKDFMFQDSCSYIIDNLIFFHDHVIFILVIVRSLVLYFLVISYVLESYVLGVSEGHDIEFLWTVLPALLLLFIAFPSLKLLYVVDEDYKYSFSYKVVGHQWYWSYEYSDFFKLEVDSYLLFTEGGRLLDTEDRLFVPWGIPLRFIVTSQDVIHSWTLPVLGVKADALPGRINQLLSVFNRPGLFFGQCSELCGANHSFMPISLESVLPSDFIKLGF